MSEQPKRRTRDLVAGGCIGAVLLFVGFIGLVVVLGLCGVLDDTEGQAPAPRLEPTAQVVPTRAATPTQEPTAMPTPTPKPTPTPEPTLTPTPAPISISAAELWAEREANATRFDDTYKGEWVMIYGKVAEVDDGEVRLDVEVNPLGMDMSQFGIDTSSVDYGLPLLHYIALRGLSRQEQAAPNAGEVFAATCKVGDFRGMGIEVMHLNNCRDGQVVNP